jgi:hypothetical protein
LDGNQPGVGKTLFARVVGMLLDGREPQVLEYSSDEEELAKRICATLRGQEQSLLLFDNAKVRSGGAIESAVIEAKCLAPQVTLRVLGTSTNFERPNDLVWIITMNQTRAAADIASRCLPVRFFVEGRPEARQFGDRNPLEYARRHRSEILGELFGLVIHWNQAGRPLCARERRTKRCIEIVGGILEAAGLPEFLTNLDEAIGAFGVEQEELTALTEEALRQRSPVVRRAAASERTEDQPENEAAGSTASEWVGIFRAANVEKEKLIATASDRGRSTVVGNWLAKNVGRHADVEADGRLLRAEVRSRKAARGRGTLYWLELTELGEAAEARGEAAPARTTGTPAVGGAVARARTTPTPRRIANPPQNKATSTCQGSPPVARQQAAYGNQEEWI